MNELFVRQQSRGNSEKGEKRIDFSAVLLEGLHDAILLLLSELITNSIIGYYCKSSFTILSWILLLLFVIEMSI